MVTTHFWLIVLTVRCQFIIIYSASYQRELRTKESLKHSIQLLNSYNQDLTLVKTSMRESLIVEENSPSCIPS